MSTTTASSNAQPASFDDVTPAPFPAVSRQASGTVGGVPTTISLMSFIDKILITISQDGRLSQWIQVPLSGGAPGGLDLGLPTPSDDLLPMAHLTPRTLLGGGGEQRETIGQLYATQIANAIVTRDAEETRTLLVGLGLTDLELARDSFFDMLELLQQVF